MNFLWDKPRSLVSIDKLQKVQKPQVKFLHVEPHLATSQTILTILTSLCVGPQVPIARRDAEWSDQVIIQRAIITACMLGTYNPVIAGWILSIPGDIFQVLIQWYISTKYWQLIDILILSSVAGTSSSMIISTLEQLVEKYDVYLYFANSPFKVGLKWQLGLGFVIDRCVHPYTLVTNYSCYGLNLRHAWCNFCAFGALTRTKVSKKQDDFLLNESFRANLAPNFWVWYLPGRTFFQLWKAEFVDPLNPRKKQLHQDAVFRYMFCFGNFWINQVWKCEVHPFFVVGHDIFKLFGWMGISSFLDHLRFR